MKERVKFDLDFLKNLFFFIATAFCAVVGYAVANMQSLVRVQIYAGVGIVIVLIIALVFTIKGLLQTRKLMEDLQ